MTKKKSGGVPRPFDLCREPLAELVARGRAIWEADCAGCSVHAAVEAGGLTLMFSRGLLRKQFVHFVGTLDMRLVSPLSCDPAVLPQGRLLELEVAAGAAAELERRLCEVSARFGAAIPDGVMIAPLKRYLFFVDGFGCFDLLARGVKLPGHK